MSILRGTTQLVVKGCSVQIGGKGWRIFAAVFLLDSPTRLHRIE